MGIARRKAGTMVRCPSCASQVTVPNLPAEKPADRPARAPASSEPAPPIFERSDFDELFNPGGVHTRPAAEPAPFLEPAAPLPSPAAAAFLKEPAPQVPYPDPGIGTAPAPAPGTTTAGKPGVWLTPGMLTLLSVGVIVALMLSFALGFLLGIKLQASHGDERSWRNVGEPVSIVALAEVDTSAH
jgi:hypothetical protein